jgi:hypothetical protein
MTDVFAEECGVNGIAYLWVGAPGCTGIVDAEEAVTGFSLSSRESICDEGRCYVHSRGCTAFITGTEYSDICRCCTAWKFDVK